MPNEETKKAATGKDKIKNVHLPEMYEVYLNYQ